MQRICVLGGGSFGTALAQLCARQGQRVTMWMRNEVRAEIISKQHKNPDYLSDFELSWKIDATANLQRALAGADWVLVALPSQVVRGILEKAKDWIPQVPMVIAAKGIETDSLLTMVEVVIDVLGETWADRTLALSGPSFAREIMQEHPTAVVIAGKDEALTENVARILFCDSFRAYSSDDIVGVEMGGALKNVMAIAAGTVSGLGLGDNTRAALITRGLAEITRVAVAKGANPLTLAGLAGVGDLVLTCTGSLSRNRAIGQALGEGKTLKQALVEVRQVAEGVRTAVSAKALVDKLGVYAPIIEAVYRTLHEDMPAREALLDLVRREPGKELDLQKDKGF